MMRTGLKLMLPMLLLAAVLLAGPAHAATKLVKKVDNFILFMDYSGSMAMKYKGKNAPKIELAQQTSQNMISMIPEELGYNGAFYTFAPFKSFKKMGPYEWVNFGEAVGQVKSGYDIFGRLTPMGKGFMELDPILANASGKTAVIVVSDGVSNIGPDAVAQAAQLESKYWDNLCFHVISLADSDEGKETLDQIASLDSCSVYAEYDTVKDDKAMKQFVKDVFYDEVEIEEVVVEEKEEVVVVTEDPCSEVVVFRSIQFDFDKSNIRPEMKPILDDIAYILKDKPCQFIVAGHTCNIGTEAYNMGLSERRAASVKEYLVMKGVSASKLTTVGYGETMPKYDNSTREGRRLNRRVEIKFK